MRMTTLDQFKRAPTYVLAAAIAAALGAPATASAGVFSGIFEMDGDATEDSVVITQPGITSTAGEDWQTLYLTPPGNAVVWTGIMPDILNLPGFVGPDNQFHHGCSDVKDLTDCYVDASDGTLPDKDDFVNGYAAYYMLPAGFTPVQIPGVTGPGGVPVFHEPGDVLIVMGADLHAENGDASLGGWLFQQPVASNAPAPGSAFPFPRSVGDVFIEADFTGGGDEVSFAVYYWTGVKNNTVQLLFSGESLRCTDDTNGMGCAISNDLGPVPAPWPYIYKDDPSTPVNAFPPTTFFEGVLNLSAALRTQGHELGCFSDFMFETRASHSITAKLHDYILGSAPLCAIAVDKSGDTVSKETDPADYSIRITNTGILSLDKGTITDTVLGDLTGAGNPYVVDVAGRDTTCYDAGKLTLEPGESCDIYATRTVATGDPDPLNNVVTAVYTHGSGAEQDSVSASNDHSVNLFQPSITFDKSANTTLSKVGHDVQYTLSLNNTSSADTPNLECTITDTLLGVNKNVTLASGAQDVTNVTRAIQPGDPDPLVNTANVSCSPVGFPNVYPASDSVSVELFQPSVQVTKTGDEKSKIGDEVTYSFTIENASSADSPNLEIASITDTLLGNLTAAATAAGCGNLAPGASCNFTSDRTVQEGDADPLNNTVSVLYHPAGFTNDVAHSDSHSVDLFQPAVTVTKGGDTLSKVGDTVTYTFTIQNSGSADSPNLEIASVTDTLLGDLTSDATTAGCGTLAPGASCNFTKDRTIQASDPDPVVNTVSVLYHPAGFPNDITHSDGHSVN
ncbi:MAG TPA: hypothetical protein ENO14_00230, partial [Chromatiales bacterium]|nr:hypothetical protein [Chromatiales bacterium]